VILNGLAFKISWAIVAARLGADFSIVSLDTKFINTIGPILTWPTKTAFFDNNFAIIFAIW